MAALKTLGSLTRSIIGDRFDRLTISETKIIDLHLEETFYLLAMPNKYVKCDPLDFFFFIDFLQAVKNAANC